MRVAYSGASTHVLIGILAREVRRRHPGITFGLYSQNFALPALGKVLRGDVEISLGRWDVVPGGVHTRVIAEEELVLAVPSAHRLAERSGCTWPSLRGALRHAAAARGPGVGDRLRRLTMEAGFDAEVVQVAPDSWTAMALVGAEVGCSLTVSSVAAHAADPHVRFLNVLDQTLPIQLRMAWRPEGDNMALRAVREALREGVADSGARAPTRSRVDVPESVGLRGGSSGTGRAQPARAPAGSGVRMSFLLANSLIPYCASSRPTPERFTPPNGRSGALRLMLLIQTISGLQLFGKLPGGLDVRGVDGA